jgi:hypothetical protein
MKGRNLITNIFATAGDLPGEINLQWDSINDATGYVIQAGKKNNNIRWKLLDIVFESKYTINGLKPQTEYCFRVAVLNKKKQNSWSRCIAKKTP